MKQYLDKKQCQTLLDMGVDMSQTMLSLVIKQNGNIDVMPNHIANKIACVGAELIPTLTIGELIERLPNYIDKKNGIAAYTKEVITTKVRYASYAISEYPIHQDEPICRASMDFISHKELIDNLFDCYVQLIKNGVIEA